jgi:hypothetical protein
MRNLIVVLTFVFTLSNALSESRLSIVETRTTSDPIGGLSKVKFQHGHMVGIRASDSAVAIMETSKSSSHKLEVKIQDAQRVILKDVSMAPDRSMAVAATVIGSAGAYAGVILLYTPALELRRIVRSDDFAISALIHSPDGTIWCTGSESRDGVEKSHYNLLRHYSSDGLLLGSLLPVENFSRDASSKASVTLSSRLAVSSTHAAVYSNVAGHAVIVALDGSQITKAPSPGNGLAVGMNFAANNSLLLSLQKNDNKKAELLEFDPVKNAWVLVSNADSEPTVIFGTDQDKLVLGRRPPYISWVALRPLEAGN